MDGRTHEFFFLCLSKTTHNLKSAKPSQPCPLVAGTVYVFPKTLKFKKSPQRARLRHRVKRTRVSRAAMDESDVAAALILTTMPGFDTAAEM